METSTLNSLSRASSAYLRSAMHQPIHWHEWGPAAFAVAQRENKPMLLDIGAVWCHWCHVMDRESYDDPEIAAIVNEHFIAVKVDRDERPDIDSRYQAAVQAVSGQRLKLSDMRWTDVGVDAIIALRCREASSQWEAICHAPHNQIGAA